MKNYKKAWRSKGFVEMRFRRAFFLIDYEPEPYYGDRKECEWKAGEHVTAFFKTQRPFEEITADFCRKWSAMFRELVRIDVRKFSGGTLTIRESAFNPSWEECNGKIRACDAFTLVKAK